MENNFIQMAAWVAHYRLYALNFTNAFTNIVL